MRTIKLAPSTTFQVLTPLAIMDYLVERGGCVRWARFASDWRLPPSFNMLRWIQSRAASGERVAGAEVDGIRVMAYNGHVFQGVDEIVCPHSLVTHALPPYLR